MSSVDLVPKKDSSWKTWVQVLGASAAILGLGLTVRQLRIRSFNYNVKVGMKSLQEGCSFNVKSSTHISSTIGFVTRPPQVYDFLYKPSFSPISSRPYIIWATSGTGKSEYDLKKLEERGSDFLHLVCKKDRMNENIVGKALCINSKQYENAYEILEEALSNLKDDQESPRCLIILEDPKMENVDELQKLHEWNKGGLCDLAVVFSEKMDVGDMLEIMSGKQSRLMEVEYLPPTKDAFVEELKKSIEEGGPSFPFQEDDLMKLLDFIDVNFSDFDFGLDLLNGGFSIEDTKVEVTDFFKVNIENIVSRGVRKGIHKRDLIYTLRAMFDNNGRLEDDEGDVVAISHFVENNIFRTKNNHYTYSKKCMEIGVAAYLESLDTEN